MELNINSKDYEGKITIHMRTSPKSIDILVTGGPNKGKTVYAIYKMIGNEFVICYS